MKKKQHSRKNESQFAPFFQPFELHVPLNKISLPKLNYVFIDT